MNLLVPIVVSFLFGVSHSQEKEWGPPPPVAPFSNSPLPDEEVVEPMIFPVLAKCRWTDDYNTQRDGFVHTAIDIRAPKMSPIVAPIDGTIGFKTQTFWIYGDDGWAVLGTHLNDDNLGTHDKSGSQDVMFSPDLVPGQHVYAGQFIGYVGMSGDASGPHLHFELFKPGEGLFAPRIRNPYPSLKAAQIIAEPRLHLSHPKPGKGEMRFDGCLRFVDRTRSVINLILVAKQLENGRASVTLGPRYVRLHLTPAVVAQAGGWDALQVIPGTSTVTCYLPATDHPGDSTVLRLLTPKPSVIQPTTKAVSTLPIPSRKTVLPRVSRPSVLVSLAHDHSALEEAALPSDVRALGFTSTLALESTAKLDIDSFDVVAMCHPSRGNYPYDLDEIAKLKQFVEEKSGGLLLLGSTAEYEDRLSQMGPFSINKLAKPFGVQFTTQLGMSNATSTSLTESSVPRWAQDLAMILPSTKDFIEVRGGTSAFSFGRAPAGPTLAGFEVGTGRVLAVALSPDKLVEALGRSAQARAAFREAILWLSGKRTEHPQPESPNRILPQIELTRGRFVFHCSSLFTEQEASAYADSFVKIYETEKTVLGIDFRESLTRLDIILVQGRGGYTNGAEVTMGTSESLGRFIILSAQELGRQWDVTGAMPGGFRGAWPSFCALLAGLKFADDTKNSQMSEDLLKFRKVEALAKTDPTLDRIDPLRTDLDGVNKATYMLIALNKRYGQTLWSRFLTRYNAYLTEKPGPCPMPKFVELLSQAAGVDLRSWFKRFGTTL